MAHSIAGRRGKDGTNSLATKQTEKQEAPKQEASNTKTKKAEKQEANK
jgi:hypothetical protein